MYPVACPVAPAPCSNADRGDSQSCMGKVETRMRLHSPLSALSPCPILNLIYLMKKQRTVN